MVTYHTHAEIIQMYKDLCDSHTDWCEYESIGQTYNGNDIWMFRVGISGSTNKVMFDSCLHGWEDLGSQACYFFLEWLLTSNDAKAKQILNRNYLLLIPVVNYDSDSRGNQNFAACPTYGVDLNRNFNKNWQTGACGLTQYECAYSGAAGPGNEPETRALATAFTRYAPTVYINTHYGGGPIIYYNNSVAWRTAFSGNSKINSKAYLAQYADAMYAYKYEHSKGSVGGGSMTGAYASGVSITMNLEIYGRGSDSPGLDPKDSSRNCAFKTCFSTVYPAFKAIMFAACQYCESIPDDLDWYNTDWSYRRKITINDTYVSGVLYNFPFYFRLSGLVSKIDEEAKDILFTDQDGITRIPHDIDTYSQGTGSIWIRIPTLYDHTSKDIYMYYGNDDGVDQTTISGYHPSSVWMDYSLVCHMNDYEDTQHLKDSTKYNATLTKQYDNKPYMVKTTLGSGQFFKCTDDTLISTATAPQFNKSIYPTQSGNTTWQMWNTTISAWVKKGTILNTVGCIYARNSGSSSGKHSYHVYTTSVETKPSQITADISTSKGLRSLSPTGFLDEQDTYITATYSSGNKYYHFYRNGVKTSSGYTSSPGLMFSSAGALSIGNNKTLTSPFSGQIDEFRITCAFRANSNWPLTEYYNVSSAGNGFYTLGYEENAPVTIYNNFFTGQGNLIFTNQGSRIMSIYHP